MNSWQLFEALKGNRLTATTIKEVEKMPHKELIEGVIEFLLTKIHDRR